MRHFLFEDKEYKINPQFKRRRNEQDSAKALARLLRGKKTKRPGSSLGSGGARAARASRVDARQRCTVKMQYSSSRDAHRFQLEKYLVREGTDVDGGRAKLYGTDIDEYKANMADRNFRIFLSPESNNVDLKALTEKFVMKLEMATGYKLHWQAANHYDTAHHHAHLLINGTDRNGREVQIPKDIVKTFMREYARDICTAQLGARTREDLELEKEKELAAKRFTNADKKIKELCNGTFRPDLAGLAPRERERIQARISNLCKMGLCTYDKGYKLSHRWEDDLTNNGRYNTFLRARTLLQYSDPASLKVFSGAQGQITGKVTKIYRTDGDASDSHAAIVEGLDGKAYFVPLFKRPEVHDGKTKTILREGEMVTIKTYESQRGRLTPVIYRRETQHLRNEIRMNGHAGSLAAEVMGGPHRRSTHQ
jgi:hypothetical protein